MGERSRKSVLFVGSFVTETDDGRVGGQMFACGTLVRSRLRERIDWVTVDTTAELPLRSAPVRALRAGARVLRVGRALGRREITTALIFCGHGASFLEKGLMALMARAAGRRVVLAPRSGFIVRDVARLGMRRYVRLVLGRVDVVVCQSPYWRALFEQIAPDANCRVVPNWIDVEPYAALARGRAVGQAGGAPLRVLFIGWLAREKGVLDLYDAFAALPRHRDVELILCGEGEARAELAARVARDGLGDRVRLRGWVRHDGKLAELARADLFVLPTYFEGFPNALIEAMAAGVPAICSDIAPIASLVRDGEHALLFPCGDAEALRERIDRAIASPALRTRLAERARALVDERFTIDAGVAAFEEIL